MTQHRGHSHPLRGHHTPDSLRGRGHTGVCLRSSRGDRTDGTCPCTGRTQAYTLCMFAHGCSPDTSWGKACTPRPWPRASRGRFPGMLPGPRRSLLGKNGSWWHFLHMFCRGRCSAYMRGLLRRSPQDIWCSTCLHGGREGSLAESGTFRKDWLQSRRHSPLDSFRSCHSSPRAMCLQDTRRHRPGPTDTCLLDTKCTGSQIHCRFHKKDDKAGVLSKCLCGDRNQRSQCPMNRHYYSVGRGLGG